MPRRRTSATRTASSPGANSRAHYIANLRRIGFTDDELALPASDRVVDALAFQGSVESVAARLTAHLEAGADHVAVQPLTSDGDVLATLRALAGRIG